MGRYTKGAPLLPKCTKVLRHFCVVKENGRRGMKTSSWIRTALCAWVAMVLATVIITRLHIAVTAYNRAVDTRQKERYLLQKCSDPDFVYNLHHHAELCERLQANAQTSPVLVALNTAAINTHVCGTHPCSEVLHSLLRAIGWEFVAVGVVALFLGINMLFFTLQNFSTWRMSAREHALRTRRGVHGPAYYPPDHIQIEELGTGGNGGGDHEDQYVVRGNPRLPQTATLLRTRGGGIRPQFLIGGAAPASIDP